MNRAVEEFPKGADHQAHPRYDRSSHGRPVRMLSAIVVLLISAWWVVLPACAETLDYKLGTYRIARGDSLSIIGQRLSTSSNALISINGLRSEIAPVGKSLNYPIIQPGPTCHRVYASGKSLYLMTFTEGPEPEQHTISIYKKEQNWTLLDQVGFIGQSLDKILMFVRDLNHDGDDECYAFRTYIASSKDNGVEGVFHAPEVSPTLGGVSINLHVFCIGCQMTEGRPESQTRVERIGHDKGIKIAPYQAYVERKANKLMED